MQIFRIRGYLFVGAHSTSDHPAQAGRYELYPGHLRKSAPHVWSPPKEHIKICIRVRTEGNPLPAKPGESLEYGNGPWFPG